MTDIAVESESEDDDLSGSVWIRQGEIVMASGTFFVRACPTCGRNLEVRVELLGRDVECVHCGANFRATQEDRNRADDQRIEQVLARAQQYIASVEALNAAAGK